MPESSPAADWLIAEFDATTDDEIDAERYSPVLDECFRTVHVQPMITFKSVTDPGEPMRVSQADYQDRQRWWL